MIRNYIKIAWRNLLKHKLFSFINIFGLASGMTVCILALTHIKGAYDYDTFHPGCAQNVPGDYESNTQERGTFFGGQLAASVGYLSKR
jgi:hypothetical protein